VLPELTIALFTPIGTTALTFGTDNNVLRTLAKSLSGSTSGVPPPIEPMISKSSFDLLE
jgi:hypothetical protein